MTMSKLKKLLIERGDKVSEATRIRNLITKQKKLLGSKQGMVEFEEPILFLTKRSGQVEFYEKATMGAFTFTHSTGKTG